MSSPDLYAKNGVLEFRLEYGLEQLESLERLTTVIFTRKRFGDEVYAPQLGMEEVRWMADNWKKLKRIIGCRNRNVQTESRLKSTVRSLGILYADHSP